MRPVYSESFLAGVHIGGTLRYTVPAGHRAIVKSILSVSLAGNGAGFNVYIAGVMLWWHAYPAAGSQQLLGLMAVAYGTQPIDLVHGGSSLHTTVAGYLLDEDGVQRAARSVEGLEFFPFDAPDAPYDRLLPA